MKKLIMTIVGVAISVIIVAACLMPVLNDAVATTDTFENAGYFDMRYTDADDITLEWDHTAPTKVTVNGDVINIPDTVLGATIMCGDDWVIRYNSNGTIAVSGGGTMGYAEASVTDATDMEVTATNGTVTVTVSTDPVTTKTSSYTYLYVISVDGDYVMKTSSDAAYLNGDSPVCAMGLSYLLGTSGRGIKITGTIDDGFECTIFRFPTGIESTSVAANYVENKDHLDLYELSSLVVTAENSSHETDTATYSYFIVPATVTAERAVHFTPGEIAIFSVIPLLIIVAILIMAVSIINRNRE